MVCQLCQLLFSFNLKTLMGLPAFALAHITEFASGLNFSSLFVKFNPSLAKIRVRECVVK
jgi:hypothetical protein